ncbi:MAG: TetR family transcriptional regulator [Hyphomonadaceae bacterium]
MKKPPRIRRDAAAAREHILAAAEQVLVDEGPLALKLAEVASAAGVANATVLHHFESIDGLHAALMQRMTDQLVAAVLAAPAPEDDHERAVEEVAKALFDVFETRGAARLAAWLELTGESKRLTHVREAVAAVVAERAGRGALTVSQAQDLVLTSLMVAMGAGLFGASLAELIGKPPSRARNLASELLRDHAAKLKKR